MIKTVQVETLVAVLKVVTVVMMAAVVKVEVESVAAKVAASWVVVMVALVVMAMAGEEEVLESVRTGKSNPISH